MLFEEWTKLEIDVSHTHSTQSSASRRDIRWRTFQQEQARFFEHMQVIEIKLATILVQAYTDCHNWEQLTKVMPAVTPTLSFVLDSIIKNHYHYHHRHLVLLSFRADAVPTT